MRTSTGRKGSQSKFNPASQIRSEEKNVGVPRRRERCVVGGSGRDDDQDFRAPRVKEGKLLGVASGSRADQVDLGWPVQFA